MKKVLATILALVMALGVTTTAWADVTGNCADENCAHKAAIGTTHYDTLAGAITAAMSGATIKLIADTNEDITISEKELTLDLNGKTLTNASGDTITVAKGATLIINGSGTVDNVTHAKAAICNNGTVTLNGGTYTRSQENAENNRDSAGGNSFYTILTDNGATMTINAGVTVTNVGHFSSMIRNGGTGSDASTLTINGGTFSGGINTVKNDEAGVLVINGGDFSNTSQYVVMNWNETTINNGTFRTETTAEAVLFSAAYSDSAVGELTVAGGTFVRANDTQKMIETHYGTQYTGTASISGGTFKDANGGKVDVSQYMESGKQQNADGSVGNIPRYYYNSTTTTDTKKDEGKTSPKTFDAGVGIYAVSAVLSLTGMAYVGKKKF